MKSEDTPLNTCNQQIEQWLSEGKSVTSITAGQLHLATGHPYSLCTEALQQFLNIKPKAGTNKSPAVQKSFKQNFQSMQEQVFQQFLKQMEREKRQAVEQAQAEFQQEKQKLEQLADERFEVITQLEKQTAGLTKQATALKQEAKNLASRGAPANRNVPPNRNAPPGRNSSPSRNSSAESGARPTQGANQGAKTPVKQPSKPPQKPVLKQEAPSEVSPDSHAWVVELSNEQAKEIADLSQQLDISQREYLRVSALYQDMKKENEKLQKSLKKYQGNH